jgi:hypothetical protein
MTVDSLTIEEIRAIEAARAHEKRARQRRDALCRHTDVLDELGPDDLPGYPTIGDVAAFFGIDRGPLSTLLRTHRDEFHADGWRPHHPANRDADLWAPQAIVRAGLLLEGTVAAQLRYLLGQGDLPVVYSTSGTRLNQCKALHEKANRIIEHVRDEGTDTLWRELQQTERYDLQALVVALAVLVPVDRPGLTSWLIAMSGSGGRRGSVARGLALLIPERKAVYRRASRPRRRRRRDLDRTAAQ